MNTGLISGLSGLLLLTHVMSAGASEPVTLNTQVERISDEECSARVNDTPKKLLECIQNPALWTHLVDFQAIADQNPSTDGHGNRDTGTAGYAASVQYVADRMRAAGYQVSLQSYPYSAEQIIGTPELVVAGKSYVWNEDWFVARLSAGGTVTAPVQNASASGTACSLTELSQFVAGNIALLQKGVCGLDKQLANAQSAGAVAVIFYQAKEAPTLAINNRAESASHTESDTAFPARLIHPATIPVLGFVSAAIGAELLKQHRNDHERKVRIVVPSRLVTGTDYNLIAESPYGDPQHVVVADAHLDSIFGAGILDNASGSASLLEIALKLAKTPTTNKLRFIWFGGEELGLLGSRYYTKNLTKAERKRIRFDIDVDVTATPNYDYMVADPGNAPNVAHFPPNVVPDSQIGNRILKRYFNSVSVPATSAWFGNEGTDSNSFSLIGIPNTGILTQQNCCKKQWEVDKWGGTLGNYEGNIPGFDGGCVDRSRRWCDNLSNNDPVVFETASKAAAYVVLHMANHEFGVQRISTNP